ncbi:MAG: methylated-DNA--[Clostridia bacterium]|nr:methylated-DNA--[protein]-cysteine S-methyltransferase [Clostridia bacterium]
MHTLYMPSPVGILKLQEDRDILCGVSFEKGLTVPEGEETPLLLETQAQLNAYFAGKLYAFDLPVDAQGTLFQRRVWQEMSKIPYGETVTYGALAQAVGQPTASRAVGMACGKNPIAIILPCHRVVGGKGKLTGFAGGLDMKRFLLEMEAKNR